MPQYVKHPTIDGDGEIVIAGRDGKPIRRRIVGGVFEWPEGEPRHTSFKDAAGSEELERERRTRELNALREHARSLGVDLQIPETVTGDTSDERPVTEALAASPVAPKPTASRRTPPRRNPPKKR